MSDKADHFRKMIDDMPDDQLERWIDGIAHLKLQRVRGGPRASFTEGVPESTGVSTHPLPEEA